MHTTSDAVKPVVPTTLSNASRDSSLVDDRRRCKWIVMPPMQTTTDAADANDNNAADANDNDAATTVVPTTLTAYTSRDSSLADDRRRCKWIVMPPMQTTNDVGDANDSDTFDANDNDATTTVVPTTLRRPTRRATRALPTTVGDANDSDANERKRR
jgi:hypothetical protein